MPTVWPYLKPLILLLASNVFMTFAWYGHLKHRGAPLLPVIFVSWMIALPEYLLAVPANRWGASVYSPVQLKIIQEAVTLIVFAVFSMTYLDEPWRWSTGAGFLLVLAGAALIVMPR